MDRRHAQDSTLEVEMNTMEPLAFTADLLTRQPPAGMDVTTTLQHFAIITYCVDPGLLQTHIHPRFQPDLITFDGSEQALLSVVPFVDQDFRFVNAPWFKWRFGQTNYRAYVNDSETGEHVAWFFGTSLDSISVLLPRFAWKLPWHRAHISFDCEFDSTAGLYRSYRMTTTNSWADAEVELTDSGEPPMELPGFDDLETGLVLLTHPRAGYYFRRDGRLGSYRIWHDRLTPTLGDVASARFALLERLGLVENSLHQVHSVLLQHRTDFTIYLPPCTVQT